MALVDNIVAQVFLCSDRISVQTCMDVEGQLLEAGQSEQSGLIWSCKSCKDITVEPQNINIDL